ncbi:hypothetical protein CRV24_008676 [Beauveria bassiana]|nr:hypothetical protein CRV24_008676 [Beauveria bassiana]
MRAATIVLASLIGHALAAPASACFEQKGAKSNTPAPGSRGDICIQASGKVFDACLKTRQRDEPGDSLRERCNKERDDAKKGCLNVQVQQPKTSTTQNTTATETGKPETLGDANGNDTATPTSSPEDKLCINECCDGDDKYANILDCLAQNLNATATELDQPTQPQEPERHKIVIQLSNSDNYEANKNELPPSYDKVASIVHGDKNLLFCGDKFWETVFCEPHVPVTQGTVDELKALKDGVTVLSTKKSLALLYKERQDQLDQQRDQQREQQQSENEGQLNLDPVVRAPARLV